MAEKNKTIQPAEPLAEDQIVLTRRQRIWLKIKRAVKWLLWLVLLIVIVVGGFFLGIYLRVFDTNTMNEKLELYKYPILNEYFVKPNKIVDENKAAEKITDKDKAAADVKVNEAKPAEVSKPIVLTKEEIAKQTKLRQAEEKKRIGKLARLYNEMKPADAATILDELDDDMAVAILGKMDESQVAKVLVEFDTDKSARLTRKIYNGKPAMINAPLDLTGNNANAANNAGAAAR